MERTSIIFTKTATKAGNNLTKQLASVKWVWRIYYCKYLSKTVTAYISGLRSLLKLHNTFKAVVSERLQCGTALILFQTRHFVVLTVTLRALIKIHSIRRVDGWIFIKIVVRSKDDATTIAHCNRVRDVFGMRNVQETSSHPGNQILKKT